MMMDNTEKIKNGENLINTGNGRDFQSQQPEEFIGKTANQDKDADVDKSVSDQQSGKSENLEYPKERGKESNGGYDHPTEKSLEEE